MAQVNRGTCIICIGAGSKALAVGEWPTQHMQAIVMVKHRLQKYLLEFYILYILVNI